MLTVIVYPVGVASGEPLAVTGPVSDTPFDLDPSLSTAPGLSSAVAARPPDASRLERVLGVEVVE